MADIFIESTNPFDLRVEDMRSLAETLSPAVQGHRFGYAYYPPIEGNSGATLWEVIYIWLPDIADSLKEPIVGALLALAVDWARKRFKNKTGAKRPKLIAIYGPNGEVLKSVQIKDESPVHDDLDTKSGPRKMPPKQGYFDDL